MMTWAASKLKPLDGLSENRLASEEQENRDQSSGLVPKCESITPSEETLSRLCAEEIRDAQQSELSRSSCVEL
jgi:hypothetical protein